MPTEITMLEAFRMNPLPFLAIFAAAGLGLALGIVGLILAALAKPAGRIVAVMGLLAGLGALGVGGLAWMRGRTLTNEATTAPGLSSKDREAVRAAGHAEAWMPMKAGLVGAAPAVMLGVIGIVLGSRKKP